MAPQDVDPHVLIDTAEQYRSAYGAAFSAVYGLPHELDRYSCCTGDDSSGRQWAQSYDPAAAKAVAAGVNVVRGLGKLHDLLACTGVNYANAEATAKRPPGALEPAPLQVEAGEATAPVAFKGALGGDVPPPSGWGMITSWLQGHLWPNGNPAKLRGLGAAWFAAAKGLREASEQSGPAQEALEDMSAPSLDQAMAQMDLVANIAEDIAQRFDALGGACLDRAFNIEEAHRQIVGWVAIAVMAIIALGAAGGLIGSVEPGGGTAAGAALGGGAGGAAAVGEIVTILTGLDVSALAFAAAGGAAATVVVAADNAIDNLQPLLHANASTLGNGGGGIGRPKDWHWTPPPREKVDPPGFPGFSSRGVRKKTPLRGGGKRMRWKNEKGEILEWDYRHGRYERYDKNGNHEGEYDTSGKKIPDKDVAHRKVEP